MRHRVWLLALIVVLAGCGGPVRISGSHTISERELQAAAQWPLAAWQKQGHRPADLADAAEAMRSHLAAQGFFHAKVDFKAVTRNHEEEALFTVHEGVRVAIGKITFPGRAHLDHQVVSELKEGLRPWYAAGLVDSAAAHIEQEYRRSGFITARVGEPKLTWSADQAVVDVAFPITEGRRYMVTSESIEFVGDTPPGVREALTALLDPDRITVYDPRLGARTAGRLRTWLLAHGHIEATVDVAEHLDNESGTAAPVFRVTPGPVHVLGSMTVRGRRRTAKGFVMGRLGSLHTGRPIDQTVVDRAVSGLYSTGLFSSVTKETVSQPRVAGMPVVTDLTVVLREGKNQRFDLSVGYGSYEQLRAGIEYVDEHFAGQGLRLHGGVNGSLKGWDTEVGILEPFRFGPGRTVGVEVGYREREEPSFEHREMTGTLDAVQRFKPSFDEARWELRGQYEYKRAQDFAIEGALPNAEQSGYYRTSTVSGRIRRDDRGPRLVDPERGTMTQVGVGWNPEFLGSNIPYVELGGDWSGYVRLLPHLVGTVHVGYLQRNPSNDPTLPIGERLFLGGEDSVRSFTQDQLGPSDADGSPVGGLSSGVANAELRWRPFSSMPNLELAGFYDIGAIGQKPWNLDSPYGQGIGGGLRYITPVGPIRLDAAYNPGERFAANDAYAIHFAVGFAF